MFNFNREKQADDRSRKEDSRRRPKKAEEVEGHRTNRHQKTAEEDKKLLEGAKQKETGLFVW